MEVAASQPLLQLVQVVIRNLFYNREVVGSFGVSACAQMRHLLPVDSLKVLTNPAGLDFLKDLTHLLNPVGLDFLLDPEDQPVQAVQLGLVEAVVELEQASEHLQALPPVQTAAA